MTDEVLFYGATMTGDAVKAALELFAAGYRCERTDEHCALGDEGWRFVSKTGERLHELVITAALLAKGSHTAGIVTTCLELLHQKWCDLGEPADMGVAQIDAYDAGESRGYARGLADGRDPNTVYIGAEK